MDVFWLLFVVCMLSVGYGKPQYNTFNPNNPFLNNLFSQTNQNFQQSQQRPQNTQNIQQKPQNWQQNQQKPQNLQQNSQTSQQNRPQSNFFFPSDATIANRIPTNQQSASKLRISEQKCNEYWKNSQTSVPVGSLSLYPVIQNVQDDSCDTSQGLIIGGENAKADEFPHMAAIGYRNLENSFMFICGGSLISDQFVLTAAHCRRSGSGRPTLVRLGVLNVKGGDENSMELDVQIASFTVHEKFNPNDNKNDVGVIKLARKVKLSKYIRPACLISPTERIRSNKAIATGWGLTNAYYGDTSDILQKVELSVISNSKCREILDDQNIDGSQLCAGEEEGGKDTCRGDSGGPLQIVSEKNKCLYSIIGITSFGNRFCGSENSPGVYTRVSEFVNWIEQKVWGNN